MDPSSWRSHKGWSFGCSDCWEHKDHLPHRSLSCEKSHGYAVLGRSNSGPESTAFRVLNCAFRIRERSSSLLTNSYLCHQLLMILLIIVTNHQNHLMSLASGTQGARVHAWHSICRCRPGVEMSWLWHAHIASPENPHQTVPFLQPI